jgi:carbon monoxide dehydrogenase subunit G
VNLSGTASLPGSPQQVWDLLTDPQRLAPLLPGCNCLEPDGPDRCRVTVKFGVAAITGSYNGSLEFLQMKPPSSLTLRFDGRGLPGFVRGQAQIALARKGSGTEVRYSGEAQVGGVIAGVGQRLLEAVARKTVQQFFDAAAAEIASKAEAPTPKRKKR